WVYSERDLDNLERSIAALGDALGAQGKGRVRFPVPREQLLSILNMSRHHMGTTRMSTDAARGVVDENCRVHGIRNLYVAGCSVFPTSGIVNPTLTIIALAMRLSDHLKRDMGVRTCTRANEMCCWRSLRSPQVRPCPPRPKRRRPTSLVAGRSARPISRPIQQPISSHCETICCQTDLTLTPPRASAPAPRQTSAPHACSSSRAGDYRRPKRDCSRSSPNRHCPTPQVG